MAPNKKSHELVIPGKNSGSSSSSGNKDSNREKEHSKQRRSSDTAQLYKCLGKLCNDDCDGDVQMIDCGVNLAGSEQQDKRPSRRNEEPLDGMSEADDADFDPKSKGAASSNLKSGRVSKAKSVKNQEFSMQAGLQKAQQFICEALNFGVESGYLVPKDSRGRVLQVSTELLTSSKSSSGSGSGSGSSSKKTREGGNEERDQDAVEKDPEDAAKKKPASRSKARSASKKSYSKKRAAGHSRSPGRSRSRKRSATAGGSRRRMAAGSDNPDGNERDEGEVEQDELAHTEASHIETDLDDAKSETKSEKSVASLSCSQTAAEEKTSKDQDENSEYDASDNDEESPVKKP